MMIESGVDVNTTRVHICMYIITYKFIGPSQRNDANNKGHLRIKPNNLDPVQKGIELLVCCSLQYITVQGDKGIESLFLSRGTNRQPWGARINAGERSNSVEGTVLNPLSYIENDVYLAGRESRSMAISAPVHRRVSQHKASDQKSQMEIYLPQVNVVYILINFSWSNTNRLYRYNVNIQCLWLFHSILSFSY